MRKVNGQMNYMWENQSLAIVHSTRKSFGGLTVDVWFVCGHRSDISRLYHTSCEDVEIGSKLFLAHAAVMKEVVKVGDGIGEVIICTGVPQSWGVFYIHCLREEVLAVVYDSRPCVGGRWCVVWVGDGV